MTGDHVLAVVAAAEELADVCRLALLESLAAHLTCGEAEAVAGLFFALGRPDTANAVLTEHARGDDDPNDAHHELWLER